MTVAASQTSSRILPIFGSRLFTTASAILGSPFSSTCGFFLAINTHSFMMLVRPSTVFASSMSMLSVDMNSAGLLDATCSTARRDCADSEAEGGVCVDKWNNRRNRSMGSRYVCQVENPLEASSIARARWGEVALKRYTEIDSAVLFSVLSVDVSANTSDLFSGHESHNSPWAERLIFEQRNRSDHCQCFGRLSPIPVLSAFRHWH